MMLQGPISWVEYADAMTVRFGPIEMKRSIAQLKRLKKEDSFLEYIDMFVSLVSQCNLSDEDQVAVFVEGLKSDNKRLITVLNPINLQQAIAYAKVLTVEENPYKGRGRMSDQGISISRPLAWVNMKQNDGGSNTKPWPNMSKGVPQTKFQS